MKEPDKADLPITGGTYLTAADLRKWEGCLSGNKLINRESVHELGQHFGLPETQSALGQATFRSGNLVAHMHDGRSGNYEAILVSDVGRRFTVILLGNNHNG